MFRNVLPVCLSAVVFAALGGESVSACRCVPPPPPKQALENSAAVFSGKVTTIERRGMQNHVTFAVERSWKGPRTKTIVVRTHVSSATCGYTFEPKESYIVYTHARAEEAKGPAVLETGLCTRTSPLKDAQQDLADLGEGHAPQEAADGDEPAPEGREIAVRLTVPSTAHRVCIRAVYRVGDELWVLSEVRGGIGGAAISTATASVRVDAPGNIETKHFVLGKDWNWTKEEKHQYPANEAAFDELVKKESGRRIAEFECFEEPEPEPDPADPPVPPANPPAEPRGE